MEANPESVKWAIKSILVDALDLAIEPSGIGDEIILFDGRLGLDSVAAIEILTAIERFFEIQFEDEQIGLHLFESVNALAGAVEYQLAKRAPASSGEGALRFGPGIGPRVADG
jgi:acyl carrier protein